MAEGLWDVVGLGQAMVDFAAAVDGPELASFHVERGGRRVIESQERDAVLSALDGRYSVRAGSSLANTLVSLSRLAAAGGERGGAGLRVGMGCAIGSDRQGELFRSEMGRSGVEMLSTGGGETGSVVVLTTDDAERTFLAHIGTTRLQLDERLEAAMRRCRVVLLEGYALDLPGAADSVRKAVRIARDSGALVGLTAGDVSLVARRRDAMLSLVRDGIDMLFSNRTEAAALLGEDPREMSAHRGAAKLSALCPFVAVTDGAGGSCLAAMGRVEDVPPNLVTGAVVDTCGAGDVYAAGVLYGFFLGSDLQGIGRLASRAASEIIRRSGASLTSAEAAAVIRDVAKADAFKGDAGIDAQQGKCHNPAVVQ